MTDWRSLPKVELHLHLEGAAPPALIRTLAAEKGIALPGVFDAKGHYLWHDFSSFLACYEAACQVLSSPEDYARLTAAVLAAARADGVIYTEVFVSPDLCGGGDPVAWREYLAAIAGAADLPGIEMRVIATAIRHFGPERALRAAELTADAAGHFVTGFGMGGEERFGHAADYADAFEIARAAGLSLTSHAGEFGGPASVAETLDALGVARIGHGVRAIEDPALVADLAARGTVLEVNPGSNIALGLYPDWPQHPVRALRDAGVTVTLSTDDPPYFHTDLPSEYAALSAAFGWTVEDFRALNVAAAKAAFCDEATRSAVLQQLLDAGAAP